MAVKDGMYAVSFGTPLGTGSGVVILQDGVVKGGDGFMYYTGTYSENGVTFTASVRARKHTDAVGAFSVLGTDDAVIDLVGTVQGDQVHAQGSSQNAPGVEFRASLRRISD